MADKREGVTFSDNECIAAEVSRLEEQRVLNEVDEKTGPTDLDHLRAQAEEASVQAEGLKVSTVGVMTDVRNLQVVRKTTYANMESQACPQVSPASSGVDVKMGGMGDGPPECPSVPVVPTVAPVPEIVWVQALLIHDVDCHHGLGALLIVPRRLRGCECTVRGVRSLLGFSRRCGKSLSLVVVYLYHTVVVRGSLVCLVLCSILWRAMSLGSEGFFLCLPCFFLFFVSLA